MEAQNIQHKRHEIGPKHQNVAAYRDHTLKKVGSGPANLAKNTKGNNVSPDYGSGGSGNGVLNKTMMTGATSTIILLGVAGVLAYAFFYRG